MGKEVCIYGIYGKLLSMKLRRNAKDPVATALESAGIASDAARRLATSGTAIRVDAGVALCREGEVGQEAFLLVSGEAVVRLPGADRVVAPGEVFGELAALDPMRRRNATVETTATSIVLAFDVRTFRALAGEISQLLIRDRAA
jgi:CRP-like cAMP-binding protein